MWRDNDPAVRRCRWLKPRSSLAVDHFALGASSLAVVSTDGQAFTANIPPASHCPQPASSPTGSSLSGSISSLVVVVFYL